MSYLSQRDDWWQGENTIPFDMLDREEMWINSTETSQIEPFENSVEVVILNGRSCLSVELYEVNGIPDNFFISPKGKIWMYA